MNIIVTGAAGFIGSHLCEKFISLGHSIIGIDNFDPFYSKQIKELNLKYLKDDNRFILYKTDVRNRSEIESVFSDHAIDTVIHLAAKAGVRPSIESIDEYYDVNISGTISLLESMKKYGVKRMLFASSSSVYGNNSKVPFSEDDFVDNPISPYAATKKSGELLCHVYSHLYSLDITCLRFFTVYGPRQRPDLAIHKFTRLIDNELPIPLYGDGSTARDYTFIKDITNGIECALNQLNGYNIYNLGESTVISLKELIKTIEDAIGKKAIVNHQPLQPGDVKITFADIAKARKELGYNPKYNFKKGIKEFIDWYQFNKHQLEY